MVNQKLSKHLGCQKGFAYDRCEEHQDWAVMTEIFDFDQIIDRSNTSSAKWEKYRGKDILPTIFFPLRTAGIAAINDLIKIVYFSHDGQILMYFATIIGEAFLASKMFRQFLIDHTVYNLRCYLNEQ
jgi:hypothetical protein